LKKETLTTEESQKFLDVFLKIVSEALTKQLGKAEGNILGGLVILTMGEMFEIFEQEEMDYKRMGAIAQALANLAVTSFELREKHGKI